MMARSELPDLKVHVGLTPHNLRDENCSQCFTNPGARILIKNPEPADSQNAGKKKYQRRDDDLFTCDAIYIVFFST